MFTKLWKKLRGLFIGEVAVLRPGSEASEIPMNRKQRRVKESLSRRAPKRRRK